MVARTRSARCPVQLSVRSPTKRAADKQRGGKVQTARRRLFEARAGPEGPDREAPSIVGALLAPAPAAAGAASQGPCEMERQDSQESSFSVFYRASPPLQLDACGPATPQRQQGSASKQTLPPAAPAATALDPSLDARLLHTLQLWRQQLVALQPLVRLSDSTLLGALAVIKAAAACRPDICWAACASPLHLYTYLAAALWLVAKLCGVRTELPNRGLMSQATSVHPQALTDFELDLLLSLEWDVTAVLRQQGLLCA